MFIPLKDIAVIQRQRRKLDPRKLRDLADSIARAGASAVPALPAKLLHAIVVRPPKPAEVNEQGLPVTQPWVLVAGGRRYAAHVLLGVPEIEAKDFGELDSLEAQILELEENLFRENIDPSDEVMARERIHNLRVQQNPEWRMKDTAKELGIDVSQVSKDLKLAKEMHLNPELKRTKSKAGAIRKIEHREAIQKKVDNVKAVDVNDLAARIITAEMSDFLRTQPDASVDLLFSDLPFGVGYEGFDGDMKGAYDDSEGTVKDALANAIPHMVRVLKPTGWLCLFMGVEHVAWLRSMIHDACGTHAEYRVEQKGKKDRCRAAVEGWDKENRPCRFLTPEIIPWIWYRPNSRQHGHWPELHAKHEYDCIQVVNGGEARLIKRSPPDVLMFDVDYKDRDHEMQKPHPLCVELISRFCVTGERVLDICYGSGAHLAAAASLGMDFAGSDLNPSNRGPAIARVAEYWKP